jgi:hypothetical protein
MFHRARGRVTSSYACGGAGRLGNNPNMHLPCGGIVIYLIY